MRNSGPPKSAAVFPNSSSTLLLRNRVRTRRFDARQLRRRVLVLLEEILCRDQFDLVIEFVGPIEITRLNETHLHHKGPTDVIAFDYCAAGDGTVRGEIFVCIAEAMRGAKRYRTTWQDEVLRYVVHGILHLCGYDDRTPAQRKKMKAAEDAALKALTLSALEHHNRAVNLGNAR